MNYQKIYNQIIERRRNNPTDGYTENHHILPSSFGGSDEKSNRIDLSAREHFLCHWMLIRIHKTGPNHYKAIHAFMMMAVTSKNHQRITSRVFERYKMEYSKLMSSIQTGEGNSQFGSIWITNIETDESKKIKKDAGIPEGWIRGRSKRLKQIMTGKPSPDKGRVSHRKGIPNKTIWIINIETNELKKIGKDDEIPKGWNRGRSVNKKKLRIKVSKIWITNIETDESRKIKKDDEISDGWTRGRSKELVQKMIGRVSSLIGTIWITNIETNKFKKIRKENKIPEGWVKGRSKKVIQK